MNDWLRRIKDDDPLAVPLLTRQEMVWVAALDMNGVRGQIKRVAQGGCSMVYVHLPPVMAVPMLAGVDRFTLLHNHPSGTTTVSEGDKDLTRKVLEAAQTCGLTLIDHIILAGDQAVSLVERRVLEAATPTALPVAAED